MKTLVLKFGGAAFATPDHFPQIASLIIARRQEFSRLVVVVSAMGSTTDDLIALARKIHPQPPQREYDMLLTAGERISMALLAMALCRADHEAVSFTGSQSGIITCDRHADAKIIDVRPQRLRVSLEQGKIAIVAGFQGVSIKKEVTTLGRGGADTTAVALGIALEAERVEFFKDVSGIYAEDPKKRGDAQHYPHLSYHAALEIVQCGAKVLHPRAIQLAAKNGVPLHVCSFQLMHRHHSGTLIWDEGQARASLPLYEQA